MIQAVEYKIDSTCSLEEVVVSAQDGDREAFAELARRFEPTIYAIAMRRLRNHAEAQELVQDVLLQILRKIGQLREPERAAGWIRAISQRLAVNRLVRGNVAISAEPQWLEDRPDNTASPLSAALDAERACQVRAGLRRLKQLDRETLTAFYVDGRSLAEMSKSFDSPLGTIKRRLHTARKRLARELEELAPV